MNLTRTLATTLAAAATGALATTLAATVAATARRRRRTGTTQTTPQGQEEGNLWRDSTGGCLPNDGIYLNTRFTLHGLDGSNQGIALALLRDRIAACDPANTDPANPDPEASLDDTLDLTDDLDLDYDEALRSCVEVALNLALNLAEHHLPDPSASIDLDEDTDEVAVDFEMLHLLAGQILTQIAIQHEISATEHAQQCGPCTAEGDQAPLRLRAQFCRDVADDLLTNHHSEDLVMRGLPVATALDVLCLLMRFIETQHGVSQAEQIDHLTHGLAQAIAHTQTPITPQP